VESASGTQFFDNSLGISDAPEIDVLRRSRSFQPEFKNKAAFETDALAKLREHAREEPIEHE
jgi:hypothetical protein